MLMRNPAQWEGVRREEKTFCEENKQKTERQAVGTL